MASGKYRCFVFNVLCKASIDAYHVHHHDSGSLIALKVNENNRLSDLD